MEGKIEKENKSVKKTVCDVDALKKCLEENKGDYLKCQSHVEAFRSSCSIKKPNSSSEYPPKFSSVPRFLVYKANIMVVTVNEKQVKNIVLEKFDAEGCMVYKVMLARSSSAIVVEDLR